MHIAQISDRSKEFMVERILRDQEETCVFMAPAITGSFGTGSSGNCVQNENSIITMHWYMATNDQVFFVFSVQYTLCGSLSKSIALQIPQFPIKRYLPGYL